MNLSFLLPASEELLRERSIGLGLAAGLILFLILITLIVYDPLRPKIKSFLFILLIIVVIVPTIYFITAAIYLNKISATGGPVHWHADFRIFACGEEFKPPAPPSALSNKVGTPLFHEHEDRRIHVEGVVADLAEVSLANFFRVQGGELTSNKFSIPTDRGLVTYQNGDICDGGTAGQWQAFVYKTTDGQARQEKLRDYPAYVLSPHALVPPGDCVVFEFSSLKSKTDQICNFYQLAISKGELELVE